MESLLMLTRSLNCYGPIPEVWGERVREILTGIRESQGFLPETCRSSADLLAAEAEKRMEDLLWIKNLTRRLQDLDAELRNHGGIWMQKTLKLIHDLILEINGF
jgi:hypothetical protein